MHRKLRLKEPQSKQSESLIKANRPKSSQGQYNSQIIKSSDINTSKESKPITESQNHLQEYLKKLNTQDKGKSTYKLLSSKDQRKTQPPKSAIKNSKWNSLFMSSFDSMTRKMTLNKPKTQFYSLLKDKNTKQQSKHSVNQSNSIIHQIENNSSVDGTQDVKINSINLNKFKYKLSQIEHKIQKIGEPSQKEKFIGNHTDQAIKNSIAPGGNENKIYQGLKTQISSFFANTSQISAYPKSQNSYINFKTDIIKKKMEQSMAESQTFQKQQQNFFISREGSSQESKVDKLDYTYFITPLLQQRTNPQSLRYRHFQSLFYVLKYQQKINVPTLQAINKKKKQFPPPKQDKYTLILDLDETLIHCNQNPKLPKDIELTVTTPFGKNITVCINIRPYVQQFLQEASKYFEIIVFTASHACYANVILDHLDPQKTYITHRLYRESCFQVDNTYFVKDLRILNRDLSKVILVDNAAQSFLAQVENGVPILDFYDNKNDKELIHLLDYLKTLRKYSDVRIPNTQTFQLNKFYKYNDAQILLKELFKPQ